ncbi:hypothetical protein ACIBEA_43935 [Streptomyces sp. NPDC051555]|uniref:hypothetical protein n=1 Tax=Streptomyces sp. NPDC051555 TaxID=3365657 RepID=UPI0037B16E47
MTAFMEAAGYVPAALSALQALGALVRLWQHRKTGKSSLCGCALPAVREDSGRNGQSGPSAPARLVPSPGAVVTVTIEGLPEGAAAVVTVTTVPGDGGPGAW